MPKSTVKFAEIDSPLSKRALRSKKQVEQPAKRRNRAFSTSEMLKDKQNQSHFFKNAVWSDTKEQWVPGRKGEYT